MVTKTQVLPSASHKSSPTSRERHNFKSTSKGISLFWPFRKQSKMFHSDSLSKLDSILRGVEKIQTSVPTSPVLCLRDSGNGKLSQDFSYASSSCSSGYSSGYSSGDSATTESDLDSAAAECDLVSAIAKVSTTEIGSSGFKLQPNITKVLSKKRNSKDNLQILSLSSFPKSDSRHSESSVSKGVPSADILPSLISNSKTIPIDLSSSGIDDLESKSSERPSSLSYSSSSFSSNASSELSNEESPRRRIKDDEGFIRRAACVCVNDDETKVVLISSKHSGGGWLLPGGGLEDGEEETAAALRETWEEAGITGSIKRRLGIFQMEDGETNKRKRTAVYVLKVLEQHEIFPEARLGRVREWYTIDSAITHLSKCKPHQIAYLKAL